jgi:hypothetical protein
MDPNFVLRLGAPKEGEFKKKNPLRPKPLRAEGKEREYVRICSEDKTWGDNPV